MAAAERRKKAASKKAAGKAKTATTAQRAFSEYKARMDTRSGPWASGPFGPSSPMPHGAPAGPAWAIPPSVSAFGPGPAAPYMAPDAAQAAAGSMSERVGTALRLGVDLVNASLMGGLRVMEGFSGTAFDHHGAGGMHHWHGGCSCHDAAHHHHCCCDDCCLLLGEVCECQPSVGTCW